MKFVVSSAYLLTHLQGISRVIDSKNSSTIEEDFLNQIEEGDSQQVKQKHNPLNFRAFLTGSVKELMRRLAIYTGQIQSTLFRVLRNTRIHSLSIFFGLCCSRSGYIFEAITGTSSHPVPANL